MPARYFTAVLLALWLMPVAHAASPAPSNPAIALHGARRLMEQIGRAKDFPQVLPLMSNRSAAALGISLGTMLGAMDEMMPGDESAEKSPAKPGKLKTDLLAVGLRYGIKPDADEKQQLAAATAHGRAFAAAVYATILKDQRDSESAKWDRESFPPAGAYKYAQTALGRVRISLPNGKPFPGTTRPYAEAVWEDSQWRLDIGALSPDTPH